MNAIKYATQVDEVTIRKRKEISNDVKLLTLHFCYAKAYKCHFMILEQQW